MNDTTSRSKWNELAGDGGTRPLSPERLTEIKDGWRQMVRDAGDGLNDRRRAADDVRFCCWRGQSPDGKKRAAALGEPAFPFEGASDARVRLADDVIGEQVIIVMAAIMRMNLTFTSEAVALLWEDIRKKQLGREWIVEQTKLQNYRLGDSPGVGIMQVSWKRDHSLRPTKITGEEVMARAVEAAVAAELPITPEDQLDLQDMLANPERREDLANLLRALWPDLPAGRAKKVATQLQEYDDATFPYPYECENRLMMKARRLGDDIFVPDGTGDLQRAQRIDVREWFTKPELREMEARGVLEPAQVAELLKHEGKSAWQEYAHYTEDGGYSSEAVRLEPPSHKGEYEVITSFYRASNADGVPGIYSVMWSMWLEHALTEEELFDDKFYPFVDSRRELLTNNLWDTRGLAELSATEQQSLKLLHDSFLDHAQLSTVPPLEVPASRPKLALVIGPLKQIKVDRPGDISFMQMPPYPQSNESVRNAINGRVDRYFGRMSATNPPDLVRLYQQSLVDFALLDVLEMVKLGLRWASRYMDPAKIQAIATESGQPLPEARGDGGWDFDTEVSFEAGMLSLDFLKEVAKIISEYVLSWDTQSTVRRDKLVRWFFGNLSPTLAREMLVPVEDANANEIKDEESNFAKISAGVEPPMVENGQNFALRLETLVGIGDKNPEAVATLRPVSKQIYQARLAHLAGQVEQQKNALIGRTMARPALAGGPTAPAA